jgi:hypothetical protein
MVRLTVRRNPSSKLNADFFSPSRQISFPWVTIAKTDGNGRSKKTTARKVAAIMGWKSVSEIPASIGNRGDRSF